MEKHVWNSGVSQFYSYLKGHVEEARDVGSLNGEGEEGEEDDFQNNTDDVYGLLGMIFIH